MPRRALEFRVVVASPSDVFETRKVIFNAIGELNRILEVQNATIRGLGWEEYASPGISSEAQQVINEQILRDYDILVAIFGTKLGSPTKSESSGTVEEIEHAISKQNSEMGKHRVQVYFCDKIESLSAVSVDELKRLADYRESLNARGVLYQVYKNEDDLQREVRINLQRPISDYLQRTEQNSKSAANRPSRDNHGPDRLSSENKSISRPIEISDSDDLPGILDHQERAEAAINAANGSINAMARLIDEINVETNRNVEEVERVSSSQFSAAVKKKVINGFAEFLKSKSTRLKQEAIAAKTNLKDFFDALTFVIDMEKEFVDPQKLETDLAALLAQASIVMQTLPANRESIGSFKKVLESIPRITIQFNQAKKLLIDALDDCGQVFDETERMLLGLMAKR